MRGMLYAVDPGMASGSLGGFARMMMIVGATACHGFRLIVSENKASDVSLQ